MKAQRKDFFGCLLLLCVVQKKERGFIAISAETEKNTNRDMHLKKRYERRERVQ
jgi:hypothetical protein